MRIPVESSTSYRGRNSRANLPALFSFTLLTLCVEAEGHFFSPASDPSAARWYAALAKPAWLPPQHWFAAIWTAAYLLQAIAAWLLWRERYHQGRNLAMGVFFLQLCLNAAWAPAFFGTRSTGIGFFVIVALFICLTWAVREAARVKLGAAVALVPYLLWTSVALAMNYSLWKLNP